MMWPRGADAPSGVPRWAWQRMAVVYDQLNITELACMELVSRKLQMCEYRRRGRAIGASQGDELLEDAHLFLGVGETRGL
eukprot:1721012-Pyramimonas_sp.AAC.1